MTEDPSEAPMRLGPVAEFDDTVIEYVTRDGESNGALFLKIGFKKL